LFLCRVFVPPFMSFVMFCWIDILINKLPPSPEVWVEVHDIINISMTTIH